MARTGAAGVSIYPARMRLPCPIRLSDTHWAALERIAEREGYGSRTQAIRHWIETAGMPSVAEERYAALMVAQHEDLRADFDRQELLVVLNAMRSWLVTAADVHLLWMEVWDYLQAGPAWEAPENALPHDRWEPLKDKLWELGPTATHALVQACERVLAGATFEDALGGPIRDSIGGN